MAWVLLVGLPASLSGKEKKKKKNWILEIWRCSLEVFVVCNWA